MQDLDLMLRQLRDAPLPERLAALDGDVLARIAHLRSNGSQRPVIVATAFALLIGVAAGAAPPTSARATTITPFGASSTLLPSTLLTR